MESLKLYTSFSNLLEKSTAMNVKTAMHVSEMAICLVLLSWYSTTLTAAVHITGGCLLDYSRLLTRPLSVFLISNAIIVAVAVLSGEKGSDSRIAAETKAAPELQAPSPAELQTPSPAAAELKTASPAAADTAIADELTSSFVGELSNSQVATADEEARKNPVEDLSTEEFNLTVEKYIARTKSFLHKERLDDVCKFEIRH